MSVKDIAISIIESLSRRGGVLTNIRIVLVDQAAFATQIDATLASVHLI